MKRIEACHRCAGSSSYEEDMGMILCSKCGFYMEQSDMSLEEFIDYWNKRATRSDEQNIIAARNRTIRETKDRDKAFIKWLVEWRDSSPASLHIRLSKVLKEFTGDNR